LILPVGDGVALRTIEGSATTAEKPAMAPKAERRLTDMM
jgi:hypothetical protein